MDAIDLPLWQSFRRTDPHTSRISGRMAAGLMAEHHKRILEALRAGPAGKTEIGGRSGLTEQQVARRMHELARGGLVVATGKTVRSASGRPERQWRAL